MRKITLILVVQDQVKAFLAKNLHLIRFKPIYIFTAQSFDKEMDERSVYKDRRKQS